MKIAVSQLLVRFMERLGIDTIFGMPGAHVLPIYDGLVGSKVKSVLVKHEQGAAFMAGGYARAAGRIGACIATAGPGATNLVTGIANAFVDRLPLLVVTGETSTHIFGKGGLQESSGEGGALDQSALFKGITRYHRLVERTDYLGQVLRQAAQILLAPDSGPVLLSLPFNVQNERVDDDILDGIALAAPAGTGRRVHPAASVVDMLLQTIAAARAPMIVAGYGCLKSGAQEVLTQLAERLGIAVVTTLKGKGAIDEASPLALGCLGVTSDGAARQQLVAHADLVIFLGAGFNERTSYSWDVRLLAGKPLVQVDADVTQLEKVFKADLAIHGDIRAVLEDLLAAAQRAGVVAKDAWPGRRADDAASAGVMAQFRLVERFFVRLAGHVPRDALVFDDNIVFPQSYYKVSSANRYFPNTGISSLGHAIPAAIGARFALAGPTFAILGDGGFQMCGMELMTAVNYRIPLNVVLINNGTLGLIRKNQFQRYGERFIDCDFINPDFALLARAFGITHHRVAAESDLDTLFATVDFVGGINLIEIILDKNAFPGYLVDR